MRRRRLGQLEVSELGLGCMGMSMAYGAADQGEAMRVFDRALEVGVTFWDTADVYGPHTNEELVGAALKGRRDRVQLATKFGLEWDGQRHTIRGINGRPEYVRQACDASLRRLGVETIDLYYLHRVDRATPIEDTMGAMAGLVEAGKVRFLGLSECAPATLERAHAVHPITAVQSEYSLWTRDPEAEVLPTCRRLGIGFVPYSPLGRGFLSGQIRSPDDLEANDWRRTNPRFQGDNFAANLRLVDQVRTLAEEKGCTPAQLALAWVLAQGDDIAPIPGTKRVRYLEENAGAAMISLGADDLRAIDAILPPGSAVGPRYAESMMTSLNG